MAGKKLVLVIIGISIIAVIIVWFLLEDVIIKENLERASESTEYISEYFIDVSV